MIGAVGFVAVGADDTLIMFVIGALVGTDGTLVRLLGGT